VPVNADMSLLLFDNDDMSLLLCQWFHDATTLSMLSYHDYFVNDDMSQLLVNDDMQWLLFR